MKTFNNLKQGAVRKLPVSASGIFILTVMIFYACQKIDDGWTKNSFDNSVANCYGYPGDQIPGEASVIYYGHKIFKRYYGTPYLVTRIIDNPHFNCFNGDFILKIRNGKDKRTRVTSAEIRINGILVIGPDDLNKNVTYITRPIPFITPEAKLEVILRGSPGSFIDLWIEGKKIAIMPSFDRIGPLCQYSTPPALPSVSADEYHIKGTWDPALINTDLPGKTDYTFIPEPDQCASRVKMEIEVITSIIPVFKLIGPVFQDSDPPELPVISENGIAGTWYPPAIDSSSEGISTYTFTPDGGQCSSSFSMDIEVIDEGTVYDIDGNSYKVIKIGSQWWMAENLKVTRYRNGDLIGTTTPPNLNITGESAPGYQWAFNGDESTVAALGRYYTWYAVTDARGVCPDGWHVPSDSEWTILSDFLTANGYGFGGSGSDIGKSLATTSGWDNDPIPGNVGNDQVTNNGSGFSALPAGVRNANGTFHKTGFYASWWSSTPSTTANNVWYRNLQTSLNYVTKAESDKRHGATTRCIKD